MALVSVQFFILNSTRSFFLVFGRHFAYVAYAQHIHIKRTRIVDTYEVTHQVSVNVRTNQIVYVTSTIFIPAS